MTDDEDTIPQSIVGTWKYNRSDFIFKSDIAEIRNAINQMVNSGDLDISENPHSVTFNEDNSFEWIEGGNSRFWGTYSNSNGNLTWTDQQNDDFSFKVTANSNTLKLSFSIIDEVEYELGMSASELDISKCNVIWIYNKQ